MFEDLGAEVIDADKLGHRVLQDEEVISQAVRRWGTEVRAADGSLLRDRIAERVFAAGTEGIVERTFWNEVMHPRIRKLMLEEFRRLEQDGRVEVVCLDAALLLEAQWDEFCDWIVLVETPPEIRHVRAASRGWEAQELAERESAQMSLANKRQKADFVIDNSGDFEQTYGQVRDAWLRFSGSSPSPPETRNLRS
jgi:dephospho-CoA kinase